MIQFRDGHKSYGKNHVLNGLTFIAGDGRITGFVGPNGAGKTTAMRALAGLIRLDQGEALVDGRRFCEAEHPPGTMSVFFGSGKLPGHVTGLGYLHYLARLSGIRLSRAQEYLDLVGLVHAGGQRIRGYSLGMRQRLGLAAALMGEPRNLVLDEPINGLDVEGVMWIRDTLRTIADGGRCILLSSHMMSELQLVADDVVILACGTVGRAGPLQTLLADEGHGVMVLCDDSPGLHAALRAAAPDVALESRENGIYVRGRTLNWVASVVGSTSLSIRSIHAATRDIEEIYLEETGRGRAIQVATEGIG